MPSQSDVFDICPSNCPDIWSYPGCFKALIGCSPVSPLYCFYKWCDPILGVRLDLN